MNRFITSFLILLSSALFAQIETAKWHFGTNASLDFLTGTPVAMTGSILANDEACASISDATGNLLFYTTGTFVVNKNNAVMANGTGLNGSSSTTQTLIIKQPSSNTIYYIITADMQGGPLGYRYSVVDMSLNGGLGGVTTKNILLDANASEKMTAVHHCNGIDIWLITHGHNNNAFRCYLVTAMGINTVPIVSNVGSIFQSQVGSLDDVGNMKASSDGSRIAIACGGPSQMFEIFDFDRSTGNVLNPINLGTNFQWAYGVEFSPDNTKLYTSHRGGTADAINQWDLCAGSSAAIISSKTFIATVQAGFFGFFAMQLALDGKIYCNQGQGAADLAVINNPNALGVACNFAMNGPSVVPGTNYFGLPNFITTYFEKVTPLASVNSFAATNCSSNGSATATLNNTCTNASYTYTWSTGTVVGPTTSASSTINNLAAGNYHVIVNNNICRVDTIYFTIPGVGNVINVNQSDSICTGASYVLPGGQSVSAAGVYNDTLLASNGCDSVITTTLSVVSSITVSQAATICAGNSYTLPGGNPVSLAGIYKDTLTSSAGCDSIITTTLSVNPATITNQSTTICTGSSYVLPGGTTVTTGGTYIDTLTTQGGCDSIITTSVTLKPNSVNSQSATICSNQIYTLPSGIQINISGTYYDTLTASNGCDSIITITLIVNTNPIANITGTTTIITGQSTTLTASGGGTYNWTPSTGLDNTTNSNVIATPNHTTTYCVEVTSSNGCKDTSCITIKVELPCPKSENLNVPNAFSPNGDNVNDEFCLHGWNDCVEEFNIVIYSRWGEKVFESNKPDFCWNGLYKGKTCEPAVFVYYINAKFINLDKIIIKEGNISLIR